MLIEAIDSDEAREKAEKIGQEFMTTRAQTQAALPSMNTKQYGSSSDYTN
ncbi:MAG: hypothetical protein HC876_08255 [Chloroflexaceae bacterium]|nr:hypothetical protein [Chloroflexaceae bacterium]